MSVQLAPSAMPSIASMALLRSTCCQTISSSPLSLLTHGICVYSFLERPATRRWCFHRTFSTLVPSIYVLNTSDGSNIIPSLYPLVPALCPISAPLSRLSLYNLLLPSSTTFPSTFKHWLQLHLDVQWKKLSPWREF